MALFIRRNNGQSVLLIYPCGKRISLTLSTRSAVNRLVCHEVLNESQRKLLWDNSVFDGESIQVDADVVVTYLSAYNRRAQCNLKIEAPDEVIILRGEKPQTVDDMLASFYKHETESRP